MGASVPSRVRYNGTMDMVYEDLLHIVGADGIERNAPMSAHTTFRVGGPADYLASPRSTGQLRRVVEACNARGVEWRVLGHGSNVLVADAGLRGVTVRLSGDFSGVEVLEGGVVAAQAGASNAKVAAAAQRAGLSGFEFAAGIPGTVGGAAVMNAGAYGGEFKQVARMCTCLTREGALKQVTPNEAGWGYRHSSMMDAGWVVVSAELQLREDDPAEVRARMAELAARRQEKQPLDMPSAGSTFKRPPGRFAGKLIQDAGMQGYAVGGAQVSTKHAGFVVNRGGATSADVLAVIRDVRTRVLEMYGVELVPEVRLWGFEGNPLS